MPTQNTQTDSQQPPRDPSANLQSPWLHAFAIFQVVVTFALLILGGTVTSKGVGMAVPDWPESLGHNMFALPPSLWQGGIFWEHTHRLLASFVGVVAIISCVWLWVSQKHRPWLRNVGMIALLLVIVQGVMGGLRVTRDASHPEFALAMRIVHGIAAQAYLCITILIAAATSRWWLESKTQTSPRLGFRTAVALLAILVVQLTLGAAMRHTGSGMAIPDFPSNYGQLIPPLTQEGIEAATEALDVPDYTHSGGYFTPAQVGVHLAHRVWAIVVLIAAVVMLVRIAPRVAQDDRLARPVIAFVALLLLQVALGASVIWTERHPEMATAHQTVGAAILGVAMLIMLRLRVLPYQSSHQSEAHDVTSQATIAGAGA